ncbi:flagellar protein FlaG [Nitrincola nitratireducens]|uniref:Flagellar protein FlaG n=1 Tax=Nitrincola nitratireducens TaxID=1229521 RepID=W9VFC8_9GAMM|nr:flagellar protein FlaG [Nitrincola nitratireducens]EXJ09360.1 flagellar protein FlaG [Nitrincola nitratireducens]
MSVESMNLTPSVSQEPLSRVTAQPASESAVKATSNKTTQEPEPQVSVEKLEAAVEKLNDLMRSDKRSLNFSVDQDAGKVVVKVYDQQTSELIRQIPTEETLKFAEHLEGMMGVIFSDKA